MQDLVTLCVGDWENTASLSQVAVLSIETFSFTIRIVEFISVNTDLIWKIFTYWEAVKLEEAFTSAIFKILIALEISNFTIDN